MKTHRYRLPLGWRSLVGAIALVLAMHAPLVAQGSPWARPLVATISVSGVRDIMLVDPATGQQTNLTRSPLEEMSPCRAGDRVYFSRCTQGRWQTWSCDLQGGTVRLEVPQESAPLQALRGHRLLMFRTFEVGIMDLGTKKWRPLRKVDSFPTAASLSPDESRLVISEDNVKRPMPEAGGVPEIRLVDLRTGKMRHLADGNEPRFKPDGSTIVFVDRKGVCLVDVASGRLSRPRLPHGSKLDLRTTSCPVFSPDGGSLAFLVNEAGHGTQLAVLSHGSLRLHPLADANELNW